MRTSSSSGRTSSGCRGPVAHRGKEAVAAPLGGMQERWDDVTWSADQFVGEGDTTVVLGHVDGRAKAAGTQVTVAFVHVWRTSGGEVKRGQALTDTAVVADALGN